MFQSWFWIKTYEKFTQDESQISLRVQYWIHPKRIIEQYQTLASIIRRTLCYQIKVFQLLNINFQHVKLVMFPWKTIRCWNLL